MPGPIFVVAELLAVSVAVAELLAVSVAVAELFVLDSWNSTSSTLLLILIRAPVSIWT